MLIRSLLWIYYRAYFCTIPFRWSWSLIQTIGALRNDCRAAAIKDCMNVPKLIGLTPVIALLFCSVIVFLMSYILICCNLYVLQPRRSSPPFSGWTMVLSLAVCKFCSLHDLCYFRLGRGFNYTYVPNCQCTCKRPKLCQILINVAVYPDHNNKQK